MAFSLWKNARTMSRGPPRPAPGQGPFLGAQKGPLHPKNAPRSACARFFEGGRTNSRTSKSHGPDRKAPSDGLDLHQSLKIDFLGRTGQVRPRGPSKNRARIASRGPQNPKRQIRRTPTKRVKFDRGGAGLSGGLYYSLRLDLLGLGRASATAAAKSLCSNRLKGAPETLHRKY